MEFTRTGLILFTENYEKCVDFYKRILELPILHSLDNQGSRLTTCDMGSGNYLMIEGGGTAVSGGKSTQQNPVWLRFNVNNVEEAAALIRQKGIEVTVNVASWGTSASFLDPDGNYCSLRDEATFGV